MTEFNSEISSYNADIRDSRLTPWIRSKFFDLFFFHFNGPVLLLLVLIPYYFLGSKIILFLNISQVVVFSWPHFCFTWVYLNPQNRDKQLQYNAVRYSLLFAFILALILATTDNALFRQIVSIFLFYFSLWHIMRQHQGICRLYDRVQSKRWNDSTLNKLGNHSIAFIALCYLSQFFFHLQHQLAVSAFSFKHLSSSLAATGFYLSCIFMIVFAYLIGKNMIWDRHRRGQHIPWPQLCLNLYALAMISLLAIFAPLSAGPLLYLVTTAAHNIQYFGYVWLFEKYRAPKLLEENAALPFAQRLILNGEWLKISIIFLAFSFVVYKIGGISRPGWSNLVISLSPISLFFSLSHYLVDGFIWQSRYNSRMKDFANTCAIK